MPPTSVDPHEVHLRIPQKSNEVRVTSGVHAGRRVVRVGVWFADKSTGAMVPSRVGITVPPGQVPAIIEGLQRALAGEG